MKTKKKGFTIVELVIVIAVIAILAAVLIPTFSNIVDKANQASDTSLVRNLNTILIGEEATGGKPTSMSEVLAIEEENGYKVENLQAKAKDYKLVWNPVTNRFYKAKVTDGVPTYETYPGLDAPTQKPYEMWTIAANPDSLFSTYLYRATTDSFTITTGLDVGEETVSAIEYNGTASRNISVYTDSAFTTLTINTSTDNVSHYGNLGKLVIEEVPYQCYYEYGQTAFAEAAKGKIVAKEGGEISVLYATANTVAAKEDGGTINNAYCVSTSEAEAGAEGYTNSSNTNGGNVTFTYKDENDQTLTADQIVAEGNSKVESNKNTEIVENGQNAETPVQYVARVGNIAYTADQFYTAVQKTSKNTVIEILCDFAPTNYKTSSNFTYAAYRLQGTLNGNNHTITLQENCFLFQYIGTNSAIPSMAQINNLNVNINNRPLSVYTYWATFNNVNIGGSINVGNNTGAFMYYGHLRNNKKMTFNSCTVSATMQGAGGADNYNAAFVGYGMGTGVGFEFNNCKVTGSLSCGIASIFLGNDSQLKGDWSLVVNDFEFGENAEIRYICTSGTNYKFTGLTSAHAYHGTPKFVIDGTEYTKETVGNLVDTKAEIFGDHFKYGPSDSKLALTLNEDGTFNIVAAENSSVVRYEFRISLYTTATAGGSLVQSVSETINVSTGTENYTSQLKNLKFVDKEWVENHADATTGTIAGNTVYILDGEMYYIIPDTEQGTLNGNPKSGMIYTVTAYDADGNVVASCGLTK